MAFGEWFIIVYLGLEGLGVFVFIVFDFLLFKLCLCFFCFVFVLLLDYFWCCSCFCFWGVSSAFCLFSFCLLLFVLLVCVGVCLLFLCFLVVFFCLILFCSLCLLEWSRCCSCFVILWFVLFVFVVCLFACACFFLFLMNITVFPAILVLFGLMFIHFLFSFQFLVPASGSCSISFLFQDVIFFLFFWLLSWVVLDHNRLSFNLLLLFLLILCLCLCFVFFWFLATYQKHLSKNWKFRKPQKWKMQKRRTFWQEQLAQVCSHVFYIYVCL